MGIKIIKKLLLWTFGAGMFAYSVLSEGFVAAKLWLWFVTGTFGIAPITTLQAAGVAALVGMVTHQFNHLDVETQWKGYFTYMVFEPWVRLLVGWLLWLGVRP